MDIIPVSPALLALLGFIVGTLSGFFGVGGAFIMTPALNILGFPMIYAIGTDLALMVGSSMVATVRHFRFGNVDVRLGLLMLIGTGLGVWIGKQVVFALDAAGGADGLLRAIYMLLLFGLAGFMAYDYYRFAYRPRPHLKRGRRESSSTVLSRYVQGMRLPPRVDLPVSGLQQVSIWAPLLLGLLTGFLAALLGVGGGFIRMPALIYGMGLPTNIAIGTDLFEIIFSSAFGTYLYAMEGKVHLPSAMIMLVGATLGAQAGSYATQHVRGMRVRLYFSVTIFAAAVSVVFKQLSVTLHLPELGSIAGYLIIGSAGSMALIILSKLLAGWSRATIPAETTAQRLLTTMGGATHSLRAAQVAALLAKAWSCSLTVLTVLNPRRPPPLDRIKRQLRQINMDGEVKIQHLQSSGNPDALIRNESTRGYDLVVVGLRGARDIRDFLARNSLLRSVRRLTVPVLVIRRRTSIRTILWRVSPTRWRDADEHLIVEVAKATGAQITLIAIEATAAFYPADQQYREPNSTRVTHANSVLAAACQRLMAETGNTVDYRIRIGLPEKVLIQEGVQGGYDLLAVSAPRRRGLAGLVVDDLPYHIAQHAPMSVLLFR